jgi:SAM-dependent methyltransferase
MSKIEEDLTPEDFRLPKAGYVERYFKRPARRILYPLYNWLAISILRRRFDPANRLKANRWLWGGRGNDYEAYCRKVNKIKTIAGERLFVAGCGTGREILSWLPYRLSSIIGIDYFNYSRAWQQITGVAKKAYPETEVSFHQGNLENLIQIPPASFDVIACNAVFEHCQNLEKVLMNLYRVLRADGILWSIFCPLYTSYGGDHFSGNSNLQDGYNHLILEPQAYQEYLDSFPPPTVLNSEHDGRTWINSGLLSKLRLDEYLFLCKKTFGIRFLALTIDPRAFKFKRKYPKQWDLLIAKGYSELDLCVTAVSVIMYPREDYIQQKC